MKNSKNILIFFIIVFILFWNPFSFFLYYSDNVIFHSSVLKSLFWILPVFSFSIIVIIKRKLNISDIVQNIIFGVSFTGILFGFLILINSLLGLLVVYNNHTIKHFNNIKKGLIFEPNTIARYSTVEFDYMAKINSIGLRNKEISIVKDHGTYRVLCFGDSYTFGWGVEVENCWPMQLEKYLHEQGYSNTEVINCGQVGQYTSTYKKYMSEVIPLLKPDLVLVGVLQLDDLAQLFENKFTTKPTNIFNTSINLKNIFSKTKYLFMAFIKASFANYKLAFSAVTKKDKINVTNNWKKNSNNQIINFDKLQKLRFLTLPDTVKILYKTGNLNPGLLYYYINYPDRVSVFNNPNNPATTFAINEMDKDIKEMKQICLKNNAKMVFINLPADYFIGCEVLRTASDKLDTYFLNNNKVDSVYKNIAIKNEIQYIQLTESFINLIDKNTYFFSYDDHPNEKGYKEIAKLIGKYLINNNIVNN